MSIHDEAICGVHEIADEDKTCIFGSGAVTTCDLLSLSTSVLRTSKRCDMRTTAAGIQKLLWLWLVSSKNSIHEIMREGGESLSSPL